jgi:1,4-dihydroxy-2-naphthoyl-CoA hydrolase
MKNLNYFNDIGKNKLPAYLGINVIDADETNIIAEMVIEQHHLAPNGYLHAGSVITLADTVCGYGCLASLPKEALGFTTIELKSNHLGTSTTGTIIAIATPVHCGKSTQVWDAVVNRKDDGKTIAIFRCTQMILYPK